MSRIDLIYEGIATAFEKALTPRACYVTRFRKITLEEKVSNIVRFGVSLDKVLLEKFDRLIRAREYTNRSEAFRDLIRQELVKKEWEGNQEVAGAVTIIYNHHQRALLQRINDIQHDFQKIIISTQHIHLDRDNCLEIIAVRGYSGDVQRLADTLKSIKGIRHGTLSMSSTGKAIM